MFFQLDPIWAFRPIRSGWPLNWTVEVIQPTSARSCCVDPRLAGNPETIGEHPQALEEET
jgi:hypothetical protein